MVWVFWDDLGLSFESYDIVPPVSLSASMRARGFTGSRVLVFAGSRVHRFAGSRVHEFAGSRVRGFTGSRVRESTGSGVHGSFRLVLWVLLRVYRGCLLALEGSTISKNSVSSPQDMRWQAWRWPLDFTGWVAQELKPLSWPSSIRSLEL